jgi:hypothetical protein
VHPVLDRAITVMAYLLWYGLIVFFWVAVGGALFGTGGGILGLVVGLAVSLWAWWMDTHD